MRSYALLLATIIVATAFPISGYRQPMIVAQAERPVRDAEPVKVQKKEPAGRKLAQAELQPAPVDEVPEPRDAKPVVRLPEGTSPPSPPLSPTAVHKLPADTFYVVEAEKACLLFGSPDGVLSIDTVLKPSADGAKSILMLGKFINGNGKIEQRSFGSAAMPYVYCVRAATTGRAEILIVPDGTTSPTNIIRRTLDATTDGSPTPDVNPTPGPGPSDPSFPDGRYKLAAKSYDWATKNVTTGAKRTEAKFLADSFSGVASKIAAGAYASSGANEEKRCEAMLKDLTQSNRDALGTAATAWMPFMEKLMESLDTINPQTLSEYREAWTEISTGLSAVK